MKQRVKGVSVKANLALLITIALVQISIGPKVRIDASNWLRIYL